MDLPSVAVHAVPFILYFMPMDIATCMYYTGIDPFTKVEVYVAKGMRDRKMQRALMQFFKPENYFDVREALIKAGRGDLIGGGCDSLIPSQPPKEALQARMERTNEAVRGEYVHTVPNGDRGNKQSQGYRPERKSAKRQDRRDKR